MKLLAFILIFFSFKSYSQTFTPAQFKDDFNYLWQTVNDNYCYLEKKHINWNEVKTHYSSQIDTITSRQSFVSAMEKVIYELYDHHCSLGTNNKFSRRLVPTSTDIWAKYENNKPVIKEVRREFECEKSGLKAGMEIISVNDVAVDKAIIPFLSETVNEASKSFALRLLLAGDHSTPRKITARINNSTHDFFPDRDSMMLENIQYAAPLIVKEFNDIGYIRINNDLYDNALIPVFDSALNTLIKKKSLVLDLRETPSGGNTTVARAILGRFINKEQFYQKHEYYAEEKQTGIKRSWEEIVSPRTPVYTGKLVVLCDHWTGSVGEGITIAFDGMKRATIIGTQMARLNGAVETFEMPNTKIRFNIPTERLYHINGTPRELYVPKITVDVLQQSSDDIILKTAINYLNGHYPLLEKDVPK